MSDLNPIINPQINLERPISDPVPATGMVDVGGALAGLVGMLPRRDTGGATQPDANTRKNLALQSFSQTVADWSNSDMSPQDFQVNVRGAALEVIGRNPEYRSDVAGIMEAVGVGPAVMPTTTEDAYNLQWNEYINSPDGVADMVAAARFAPGGTLDEAETYAHLQISFQQRMADKSERQQMADELAAAEANNKLYGELETKAVRTLSPKWGQKASDVFSGMFGAAAQGDTTLDSPEEQIAAVINMRRQLELQFRSQAAEAGITDPTKYEPQLVAALAPFDTILEGLKSKEVATTSYLNAYNAMAEVKRTEAFVSIVGYIKGTSPAYQEAAMSALATAAYSDGLDGLITAFEQQGQLGRPEGLSIFPGLPATAAEGVGTPVTDVASPEEIAKLQELEKSEPGALANQIALGTELLLASKDTKTTFDSFSVVVGASSAQENPLGINRLKSILNPTAIRILSQAAKDGSTGQDIESLVSTFAGEQLRRNKVVADNLVKGLNGVSTEFRDGKLLIIQNGRVLPAIVNPKGMPEQMGDLITAVNNINYINSSVARIGAVGEAATGYTTQMFQTQPGDIQSYLNGTQDFSGQLTDVQPMSTKSPTGDYVGMAQVAAQNAGVDSSLFLALVDQESKFDPNATSQVGAFGLTQAMPNTAANPGFGVRPLTDTGNPAEQLRFGAEYLGAMLKEFNGDTVRALVAYNWGVGNAQSWDGRLSSLPGETQNYVKKILGNTSAEPLVQQLNTTPGVNPASYLTVAEAAMGLNENSQNGLLTEFLSSGGVNINPAETAWCAGFVNATLAMSGMDGTQSLMAKSFLNWGTPVDEPQIGDIVIFNRPDAGPDAGHVGFFKGYDANGDILVLGGNQGDSVSVSTYSAANLAGFRRAPGVGNNVTGDERIAKTISKIAEDPEYLPVGAPTKQAPVTSPAPQPNPQQEAPTFTSTRAQPTQEAQASEKATTQLNQQTIALLKREGIDPETIQSFGDEGAVQAALDAGQIKDGDVVNVNGQLVMVEDS